VCQFFEVLNVLILVSNDDGVLSPGLTALVDLLETMGRVVVVAPDRERSAAAHALTLHRPLRYQKIREGWYAVDGTPTDCVHLAVHGILDQTPDLLVSGINPGPNLGDDVSYSGTVGVAFEGALFGIPGCAVSLDAREDFHFDTAARAILPIVRLMIENGLPPGTFLNVNVPNVPSVNDLKGMRATKQARRIFGSGVLEKHDPRGRPYYWIGARELGKVKCEEDTDVEAVEQGFVSVTPVRTDMTDHMFIKTLGGWIP